MEVNIKIIESPQISIRVQKNKFGKSEKEKIRDYFEKNLLSHFKENIRRT